VWKNAFYLALFLLLFVAAVPRAAGDSTSYTGTLAYSTSTFDLTLNLAAASDVTLQTYGFESGGTDPFVGAFSGTGDSATILTDAFQNPFGTSLVLSNYASFMGCGPAATVNIGGTATCGDITMDLGVLAAGTYTILLSDGQYIPNAVFDNGTLGEGFSDFTGGTFCNALINGVACPNTSGNYALDVTTTSTVATPEPGTMLLLAAGMAAFGIRRKYRAGH
jgi:hypothetical protein